MILGGARRDASTPRPSQSRLVIEQRCERPTQNHVRHTYVRPGYDEDLTCPGGPPAPADAVLFDLAVSAA